VACLMFVPVVGVGEMVMHMGQWSVRMPMIMIGSGQAHLVVRMLMMAIMVMHMLVRLRFVHMLVFVIFG